MDERRAYIKRRDHRNALAAENPIDWNPRQEANSEGAVRNMRELRTGCVSQRGDGRDSRATRSTSPSKDWQLGLSVSCGMSRFNQRNESRFVGPLQGGQLEYRGGTLRRTRSEAIDPFQGGQLIAIDLLVLRFPLTHRAGVPSALHALSQPGPNSSHGKTLVLLTSRRRGPIPSSLLRRPWDSAPHLSHPSAICLVSQRFSD